MARGEHDTIVHDSQSPLEGAKRATEQHPALLLLSGTDAGKVIRLEEGANTVGRGDDVTIPLNHEGISRTHAKIDLQGTVAVLMDLGSTNGTRCNGDLVGAHGVVLKEGDVVLFGKHLATRYTLADPVVENLQRKLFDAAVADPLTGIYNKRYLIERFEQEFAFSKRHDRPLTVMIYDLDHFKLVNDTHGHQVGDGVLRLVTRYVDEEVRKEDLHARWGGEEFVVLMRETNLERAAVLAERLREGISQLRVPGNDSEGAVSITVSMGLASTGSSEVQSPMELFIQADRQLYRAKQAGRDRISVEGMAEATTD